jgi:NDP-sugar pyrophosphorylase family protein
MIEIHGKPFLQWQLELLAKAGINQVVLCLGYGAEKVTEFLRDYTLSNLQIEYSFDRGRQLGTGGALLNAFASLPEEFFVLYGDSYVFVDFNLMRSTYLHSNSTGLMTVIKGEKTYETSNVRLHHNRVVEYKKGLQSQELKYVDYGCNLLSKYAFGKFSVGQQFDLSDIYTDLADSGQLVCLEIDQPYFEIGSADGLSRFKNYIVSTFSERVQGE